MEMEIPASWPTSRLEPKPLISIASYRASYLHLKFPGIRLPLISKAEQEGLEETTKAPFGR